MQEGRRSIVENKHGRETKKKLFFRLISFLPFSFFASFPVYKLVVEEGTVRRPSEGQRKGRSLREIEGH